ncbi:MAG: hypothetical protein RIC19_12150 [Phaeodactylibacter sp.]|uniref:hypothetical protein n=1 Tax=Phaeodactylibacter sp. TaxID=1940289 RepID=UPI0032EBEB77
MTYVYVVCGATNHIQLLHLSIRLLRKHSREPIVVITDLKRNERPIEHDTVVQVDTPPHYSNAEAAIFLKTGLWKWLALREGELYCYLDTDVFAVSNAVDKIFGQFVPPVTFAKDQGNLHHFSPNAVYDPQTEEQLQNINLLKELYLEAAELDRAQKQKSPDYVRQIQSVKARFHENRPLHTLSARQVSRAGQRLKVWGSKAFFRLSRWIHDAVLFPFFLFDHKKKEASFERLHQALFQTPFDFKTFAALQTGLKFDEKREAWFTRDGQLILEENLIHDHIATNSSFRWDSHSGKWRDQRERIVEWPGSNLLKQRIEEDFHTTITAPYWVHWNGGVFLFSNSSVPFLKQWHEWTLRIFNHPKWKIRDQGTLTAVVWDRHLSDHPTLPAEFNLIADYYTTAYTYLGNFSFKAQDDTILHPAFVHIFHEAGNMTWPLWRDIEQLSGS